MFAEGFRKIWKVLNGGWELDERMADTYTRAMYETEVIGPAWNHIHVQSGIRDIFHELREAGKPILFIHGEMDFLPSNPENVKLLASALPNTEVCILKKGGHMFFNKDIWELLFRRISNHLAKSHVYTRSLQ